jgi:CBS domain-containing protein
MPKRLKIIPDVVRERKVCAMRPDGLVDEAARRMKLFNIGAVVIVDNDGNVIGIVTERDITRKVVAEKRDATHVSLSEIMTSNPDTLAPNDTAHDALDLMRLRGYRHLPVLDDNRLIGMVSVRDLYEVTKMNLEQLLGTK